MVDIGVLSSSYEQVSVKYQLLVRHLQYHNYNTLYANIKLIEKITYSQYIAEEQAKAATEVQRDIVERLLTQLPKGERTVVTLHYFQEMTCKEIR